jgi:hypothetical protein
MVIMRVGVSVLAVEELLGDIEVEIAPLRVGRPHPPPQPRKMLALLIKLPSHEARVVALDVEVE